MPSSENHVRRNVGPGRQRVHEKPKNFKKSITKLLGYEKSLIPFYIISMVFAIISSICSIVGPNRISDLTDVITQGLRGSIDFTQVKSIALSLVILYLASAILSFSTSFIMATVANKLAKFLRSKISVKINKLPLKYFDKHSFGDILSRVTNDVDTIGMSISRSLDTFVSAIALLISSVVMMFYTNGILAITAIVTSLIGFSFMFLILGKSQKYFNEKQVKIGNLNGHIEEMYSSYNVVKVYNGKNKSINEFKRLNNDLFDCSRMSQFLSGLMQPIMNFIGNLSYVAVCVVGSILAKNDIITFGVIVAFIMYVRLFTSPLQQIAQGLTNLQSAAAASERVFEFLEEQEMQLENDKTKYLKKEDVVGNIEFNHVKFGYDDDRLIIKDFSCSAKPGQKIAIVGPTGAGKTTLVNLLMRFYEINSGEITIDGIKTSDLTRENIHNLFVMVLQDTWLFNGTIRENIVYNKENVTDKQVLDACKTVGLEHFIKSLPNGLDTHLSDAESISAGQKQLLTIARGMIENTPFLILDEATSNVDTRTEELVQKAMDKLTEGKTSFIIAHRLSTIKNADLILVVNEGNIIEQGNHEELMKKNGFYADLYNSQFRLEAE
jgi:ATP-binding cassette subfamily B protein